jgi:hypothetical protein
LFEEPYSTDYIIQWTIPSLVKFHSITEGQGEEKWGEEGEENSSHPFQKHRFNRQHKHLE